MNSLLRVRQLSIFLICLCCLNASFYSKEILAAQPDAKIQVLIPQKLKKFISPSLYTYKGFHLREETFPTLNSNIAILVNFEKTIFEMQALKDVNTLEAAEKYIDDHLKLHQHNKLEIRELPLFYANEEKIFFWVGDRSFSSLDKAKDLAEKLTIEDFKELPEKTERIAEPLKEEAELKAAKGEDKEESTKPKLIDDLGRLVKKVKPSLKVEYSGSGETSYRQTGLSRSELRAFTGYFEHRAVVKGYKLFPAGGSLDLYIKMNPSLSSTTNAWESKLVYGVGLEQMPLKNWKTFQNNIALNWIHSLRWYMEFLNLRPLKANYSNPTYDRAVGLGLYKEYNFLGNESVPASFSKYFWGEAWGDFSYHTTNFSSAQEKTLGGSVNLKVGMYWFKSLKINLMPYAFVDASINENQKFWESRAQFGGGFRLTPFRSEKFKEFEWLYNIRLFAEYHDNVQYFKDDKDNKTPNYDVRIGIGYSLNRYY